MTLTVGSLFSGIGGFDLGLERAGMRTVWFCEQDEFCRRVLGKHWPGVPCHPDVRAIVGDTDGAPADAYASEGGSRAAVGEHGGDRGMPVPVPPVDVLCGGFPCQDLSVAGRGAGITGQRSGLWSEFARLVRELSPRYVLVENVAALASRGLGRVLGDLAACGYDAEWDCVPASAVGAPHRRDRIWIVAYPARDAAAWGKAQAGTVGERVGARGERTRAVADSPFAGLEGAGVRGRPAVNGSAVGDTDAVRRDGRPGQQRPAGRREPTDAGWWESEPDVGRVAHGVPHRVDRLRALGNSLVPQIPELIGRRIIEWEAAHAELEVAA